MSEFQYYEFVAIDRPLSLSARKRLRAITSRACSARWYQSATS
jgi:hypothetical protein